MHTVSGAEQVGEWVVSQWLVVAEDFEPGRAGQRVTPILDAAGWLKYLSKHAARGVRHYQRQGKPAGWEKTGRLWRKGGQWPVVEPLRLDLSTDQAWRFRRLVKRYAIAQVRAEAIDYERRGRSEAADHKWDSVSYLRRMLKSSDRVSSCRGVSEWASQQAVIDLARAVGWEGALA